MKIGTEFVIIHFHLIKMLEERPSKLLANADDTYRPMRLAAIAMLCRKSSKDKDIRDLDMGWNVLCVGLSWANGT